MSYRGTVKNDGIALDEPLPFAEGTRVEVSVELEKKPRKGSPRAILELAGSLTDEEEEVVERAARECRRIDWSLWRGQR